MKRSPTDETISRRTCLAALLATAGCRGAFSGPPPPAAAPVLPPTATLDQVTAAIQENSNRVRSLYAPQARIRSPMTPSLRATIAWEEPQRFRLQGRVLSSTEVDLGSNDEFYWAWNRINSPDAIFYARHADGDSGAVGQQVTPLPPEQIRDLFGLVQFSPLDEHHGPISVGEDLVKISTRRPWKPSDPVRVVVYDLRKGAVVGQHLYDANNERLASANLSKHTQDATSGALLPGEIDVDWPGAGMKFTIDLGEVETNNAGAQLSTAMWQMPQMSSVRLVNLNNAADVQRYLAGR